MLKSVFKFWMIYSLLLLLLISVFGCSFIEFKSHPDDTGTFPSGMTAEQTVRYYFEQMNKQNYKNAESVLIKDCDTYKDASQWNIISCNDFNLSKTYTEVEVKFNVKSSFFGIGRGLEDGEYIFIYSLRKVDEAWMIQDWGPPGV